VIDLHIDGAVATATLARAPVNAINDAWLDRLDEIIEEIAAHSSLAVLWLRSAQAVFCAGADLELMRDTFPTEAGRARMLEVARRMQRTFARIEALGVVSIAELNGAALGGGFELALSCDLRVAADTAKLGLPEARLGLLPGAGGTQRMTRLAGDALARRLILGAEILPGSEAAALGLVHWVAPQAELPVYTRSIVARIAALPAPALAACKRCIAAALTPGADGYAVELVETRALYASADTQARVARFLDKRS